METFPVLRGMLLRTNSGEQMEKDAQDTNNERIGSSDYAEVDRDNNNGEHIASPRLDKTNPGVDNDSGEQNLSPLEEVQTDKVKSKAHHVQWCAAFNCRKNRFQNPETSLFRFPLDEDKCKKWVYNCRRKDMVGKSALRLHRGSVLCSDHFEDDQFTSPRKNRLKKTKGIPTIFNFPKLGEQIPKKRFPGRDYYYEIEDTPEVADAKLGQSVSCSKQTVEFKDKPRGKVDDGQTIQTNELSHDKSTMMGLTQTGDKGAHTSKPRPPGGKERTSRPPQKIVRGNVSLLQWDPKARPEGKNLHPYADSGGSGDVIDNDDDDDATADDQDNGNNGDCDDKDDKDIDYQDNDGDSAEDRMATSNGGTSQVKKRLRLEPEESKKDETIETTAVNSWDWKVFNDSIHGHIEVNEACLAIIDTPQFQRLRFIKQLGFCYYVYPGASHNRFEHSIGVYHLAGQMVRSIQSRQPDLGINDKDILCVEIAGLCHDLGHGPHSHMFDGKFIPKIANGMNWTHEVASLQMLDHMIEANKFMEDGGVLRRHGLDYRDIVFIKELINGPLNKTDEEEDWPYEGRKKKKAFLYEIISNKRTGIDVDKWDYFARDCHHLGIVNNFNHNRYIKFVRVLNVNGQLQICSRDKEIGNLYQMFYTRYILHRSAYQHKVACAIEIMAVDALVLANDYLQIPCEDEDGNVVTKTLFESITDMSAYMYVTDNILWQIYTWHPASCVTKSKTKAMSEKMRNDMTKAKNIIKRLHCRNLYQCLDERSVSTKMQEEIGKLKEKLPQILRDEMIELSGDVERPEEDPEFQLHGSHFRLQIVYMDFGKKDQNPLKAMRYYSKNDINTPINVSKAGLLTPPRFTDILLRVYSTDSRAGVCRYIKAAFEKLCARWDIDLTSVTREKTAMAWEDENTQTPEKKPLKLQPEFSAGFGFAHSSQDF